MKAQRCDCTSEEPRTILSIDWDWQLIIYIGWVRNHIQYLTAPFIEHTYTHKVTTDHTYWTSEKPHPTDHAIVIKKPKVHYSREIWLALHGSPGLLPSIPYLILGVASQSVTDQSLRSPNTQWGYRESNPHTVWMRLVSPIEYPPESRQTFLK